MGGRAVLVVTGLKREAALLAGDGLRAVVSGGDAQGLAHRLKQALNGGPIAGVLSVGLAGALSPAVHLGDWVVAEAIADGDALHPTDGDWTSRIQLGLETAASSLTPPASPGPAYSGEAQDLLSREKKGARVFVGRLVGVDHMVVDAAAKAALHARTGALAADMESHVAARFAAEHGLPFAAVRVISDAADRALPKAAQAGMKRDGGMDILAVLASLAADPRQLPALIRTGREAELAFGRLRLLGGDHLLCGPGIGCPYLG